MPQSMASSIRSKMETCQAKIERLTATLATNGDSAAAKYIVLQIEKLDCEYNELRRKLLSSNADDRRAAANYKNAMEKRDEIIRLLNDFDSFSADERNEIAKNVLKECTWDGETLFIML